LAAVWHLVVEFATVSGISDLSFTR
jgi:hypothetical protein